MENRLGWLDHAKGLCIILVVMLYATAAALGTLGREGWLHLVGDFAHPFRMPDFFLLSGLLLSRVIDRDWSTYLDRKVLHFAYFYVLWMTILLVFEAPWMAREVGWWGVAAEYAEAFVNPYSMLWFIYLLPIFFVVTKFLRRVPAAVVWTAAAALQVADPDTGTKVGEKFALYYVFFYSGFVLAPHICRLADAARARARAAWLGLAAWGAFNTLMVYAGYADIPLVSLAMAFLGCGAIVVAASLVERLRAFAPLAYCGRNTLVIYLAFLIPMSVTRELVERLELTSDPGWLALLMTIGGVVGALAMYWTVRGTRLRFLFERPAAFTLSSGTRPRRGAETAASA
jgi:uncharacterized membrane protein YcfT